MKKKSLEIKVAVLLTIAVLFVIATGYLSYKSLSYIVSEIHKEANPDFTLIKIKEINNYLKKAEDNINLYSSTNKDKYLKQFNHILSNINEKTESLYILAEANFINKETADSVIILIKKNIQVYNELLFLHKNKGNNSPLQVLSTSLKEKESLDDNSKLKNFFKRIFKKKKDDTKQDINVAELKETLKEIEKKENLRVDKWKLKEHLLLNEVKSISSKINLCISKIEEQQSLSLIKKAGEAEYLAKKTFRWLGLFCLSGVVLLIMVILIVFNYVKKTRLYQKALLKARNEAYELAKAKEIFIAGISHEIRNPMNAIVGFTEQLLKYKHNETIEKQLKIVSQAANNLLDMINNILDFSKIKAGKLILEEINFNPYEILNNIFELNQILAEKKNLEFNFYINDKIPDTIIGDPLRLRQIIMNLLSNAIKFTSEGFVKIHVDIASDSKQNITIQIVIKDTGIGIDKKKLPFIFNEFTQAESDVSRNYGGTGLGLAIVKDLVKLQKGKLNLQSNLGEGTEITLLMPYKKALLKKTGKSMLKPVKNENKHKKITALIVDDEEYNRSLLKVILNGIDVDFDEANNGFNAIKKCKEKYFDIIFMDIRMPLMDGVEAAKQILSIDKYKTTIIAVSATKTSVEQNKWKKAGIEKIITKPFKEEDIISVLDGFSNKKNDGIKINNNSHLKQNIINIKKLKETAAGDNEFLYSMLEMFIKTSKDGIKNMRKGVEQEAYDEISDFAHKIVSPARHLEINELVLSLKQIEQKADEKIEINELLGKINDAENILNQSIRIIKEEMEKIKQKQEI